MASQWKTGVSFSVTSAAPGSGLFNVRLAGTVWPAVSHSSTGISGPPAGPLTPKAAPAPARPVKAPVFGTGVNVMLPSMCALPTFSPATAKLTVQLTTGTLTGLSPVSGAVKSVGPASNVHGKVIVSHASGRKQSLIQPSTLKVSGTLT